MPADDHQRICETVYRYAYGIDTRDWELYRSIFTDEVAIDFTSYRPGRPAATMAADVWVGAVRGQMTGLAATHHAMTNPVLSIDGVWLFASRALVVHYQGPPDLSAPFLNDVTKEH